MTCGIYVIRNTTNGNLYVGSSVNIEQRKRYHFNYLKRNVHDSQHLQHAYNKYGKDAFELETMITCHPDNLIWYEQQFIDGWHPEYNIRKIANSNVGIKLPSMCGRYVSSETREKLRQSKLGIPRSDETKRKLSEAHKGKPLSEEHKKKLSISGHKKRNSKEQNHKISVAHMKHKVDLVSPDGIVYHDVVNIKQFSKSMGYKSHGSFYDMLKGNRKMAYGWRVYNES
jgi:group I intron endonuclease